MYFCLEELTKRVGGRAGGHPCNRQYSRYRSSTHVCMVPCSTACMSGSMQYSKYVQYHHTVCTGGWGNKNVIKNDRSAAIGKIHIIHYVIKYSYPLASCPLARVSSLSPVSQFAGLTTCSPPPVMLDGKPPQGSNPAPASSMLLAMSCWSPSATATAMTHEPVHHLSHP